MWDLEGQDVINDDELLLEQIWLTISQVLAKEDPSRPDQSSKSQQEAQKEPDLGSFVTETAVGVSLAPELSIGHRVDHEHGDGAKDSTDMKHIPQIWLVRIHTGGVYGQPPTQSELKGSLMMI